MAAAPQDEPGRPGRTDEPGGDGVVDGGLCRCGHAREAHSHFRKGSDCALCPTGDCPRFRPVGGGWRGLFRKRT